jgi:hypothetical protein
MSFGQLLTFDIDWEERTVVAIFPYVTSFWYCFDQTVPTGFSALPQMY